MTNHFSGKFLASIAAVAMLGVTVVSVQLARGDGTNQATAPDIKIDSFTFSAPSITVSTGTEVTWVNRDDIPHTVTSDDGVFHSKALDTDDKFSFKFSKPGTYHYFCTIHPKMTAEIIVK